MNYLELCRQTRSDCGEAGDGPSAVTGQTGMYAKIVGWVREAYTELQAMPQRWRFLRATLDLPITAGIAAYPLSTWNTVPRAARIEGFDTRRCHLVDAAGNVSRVAVLPYAQFVRDYPFVSSEATRPDALTILLDGSVQFSRTPDQAYTLRADVTLAPQVLAAAEDVPDLPAKWHSIIVLMAARKWARQRGAREKLADATQDYRRMLPNLVIDQCEPIEYRACPPDRAVEQP